MELLEHFRIDDPVGAWPVHGACGIWGTLSLGLFASGQYAAGGSSPFGVPSIVPKSSDALTGLFYGGGMKVLEAPFIGSAIVCVATFASAMAMFAALNAFGLLRVSKEGELIGLDITDQHGISPIRSTCFQALRRRVGRIPPAWRLILPRMFPDFGERSHRGPGSRPVTWRKLMKKIEAIIQPHKLDAVMESLKTIGIDGLTVLEVRGHGRQKGHKEFYRGQEYRVDLIPKIKLEMVVPASRIDEVTRVIATAAQSGNIGDGKIFVLDVGEAIRIRNDERGEAVL